MVTLRVASCTPNAARIAGRCLVGSGLILLALNLCGMQGADGRRIARLGRQAVAQTMDVADPDSSEARAALQTYAMALRSGARFDLEAATHLVHGATTHSDERRIGITENWLQWLGGKCYPPLSRIQSTKRLLANQLANCSERAQILKSLAETAGLSCRFVGLNGHVVLEVKQGGRWVVADPGYDVVFSASLSDLEQPTAAPGIRARLLAAGYAPETVENYLAIVQSPGDNVVLPVGSALSPRLYRAEIACAWLAWLFPLGSILCGLRLSSLAVCRSGSTNEDVPAST